MTNIENGESSRRFTEIDLGFTMMLGVQECVIPELVGRLIFTGKHWRICCNRFRRSVASGMERALSGCSESYASINI